MINNALIKAITFVLIMFTGYALKKLNYYQDRDFQTVTKLIMHITLPAVIIHGFSRFERDYSLLLIVLLSLLFNFGQSVIGYLAAPQGDKSKQAFNFINYSGYNIGNFSLPFLQSMLDPMGVVLVCLFDAGNALVTCGGSYAVAAHIMGERSDGSILRGMAKRLFSSIPFDTYVIMFVIGYLGLRLPEPVYEIAGTFGSANAFLAMFMLGGALEISLDRSQVKEIGGFLVFRYACNAAFAFVLYQFMPFSLTIRQILAVLAFSPFATLGVVFTERLGLDKAKSALLNSLSIPVSLVSITLLLSYFGIGM